MYLENNRIRQYPVRIALSWSAVVLWMAVIFAFSHQTAEQSSGLSSRLAVMLIRLFQLPAGDQFAARVEGIFRSLAHGFVFFILALLVSWAFSELNVTTWRNAFLSLLVSALYAAFDEVHQFFIPGRAAEVMDFAIDLAGIATAIILFQLVATIRELRRELQVQREEDLRL